MATTPIVINHLSDLQAIQNNLSGYYVLGANIDASGFVFLPIGSAANPFAGFFDGQGHTISNLTINNVSNTDSGLFGDIGATGTVSNVGLINESVTSSYSYVGGLVGENFGTVSQSYVTGNVSGATYVGALVGFNGASGSIIQSFATGAASGQVAGGLVGLNGGAISDSYATGAVNNISQDAPDSRITNFYHTLDPIYELTPPLSLFAEFVRSSGSFVQQQFFKGQLQDFLVKSPYGFSSSEAGISLNDRRLYQ